jgi:hypothetical protein
MKSTGRRRWRMFSLLFVSAVAWVTFCTCLPSFAGVGNYAQDRLGSTNICGYRDTNLSWDGATFSFFGSESTWKYASGCPSVHNSSTVINQAAGTLHITVSLVYLADWEVNAWKLCASVSATTSTVTYYNYGQKSWGYRPCFGSKDPANGSGGNWTKYYVQTRADYLSYTYTRYLNSPTITLYK